MPAGFRAAAVVAGEEDAAVLGLAEAAEEALERVEVRREAVPKVDVRRFSSSEADAAPRAVVDVVPVVDRRFVAVEVELAVGRVGGLLNPPLVVLVRVAELAVGFAAEEVVPGRRAAVVVVAGLFAAVVPAVFEAAVAAFFTGAAAAVEEAGFGSAGGSSTGAGDPWEGASVGGAASATGASSCCGAALYCSVSDIIAQFFWYRSDCVWGRMIYCKPEANQGQQCCSS